MSRILPILGLVFSISCAGTKPAPPLSLSTAPEWKTLLDDFPASPLASDGRRLFVATRDGALRALEPSTGEVLWRQQELPGMLASADGALLLRNESGRLTRVQPRTGSVLWTLETGVTGALPPAVDGEQVLVAGGGLAAADLATGRLLWSQSSPSEVTALPVAAGTRWLIGEGDGSLRCRDRATGASLWALQTGRTLRAPALFDPRRNRAYLGTTGKRILEVKLASGRPGWRWTVGADITDPGVLLPRQVIFASFDAVVYSLRPGGNLAWRASLPSRPLSGPMPAGSYLVVACLDSDLVFLSPETGKAVGRLRTAALIRTAPLVLSGRLVVGLSDRSVVAYALRGEGPAAAPPEPPAAKVDGALPDR